MVRGKILKKMYIKKYLLMGIFLTLLENPDIKLRKIFHFYKTT